MLTLIPIITAFVSILFDILTGILKGIINKNLKSSIMRKGLWKKLTEVILLIACYIITWLLQFWEDLPIQLSHLYNGVCIYIITMEIISIFENIKKINPDISLMDFFKNKGDHEK